MQENLEKTTSGGPAHFANPPENNYHLSTINCQLSPVNSHLFKYTNPEKMTKPPEFYAIFTIKGLVIKIFYYICSRHL